MQLHGVTDLQINISKFKKVVLKKTIPGNAEIQMVDIYRTIFYWFPVYNQNLNKLS